MTDTGAHADKLREQLAPRAKPKQNRSQARLQALLDAAEEVIAESGLQGLAMREVARRTDLTIASVYHYFPSTASLVRALIERHLEKLRGILDGGLRTRFAMDPANVSIDEVKALLIEQTSGFIDDIADFFFTTPCASEIWGGLQAYPELRTLDIEDTKRNAALIEPIFTRFIPSLQPGQAATMAMVLVESVSASLRFASGLPPDVRAQVVDSLKSFVTQWLTGLLQTAKGKNAD